MKKIIIVLLILGGLYYQFGQSTNYPEIGAQATTLKTLSFARFIENGGALSSLAVSKQNTIIEVFAPSCPACKRFDQNYKSMQRVRPDVNLQKVDVSDKFLKGGLSRKVRAGLNYHHICYTPHILIIDSKGEIVAEDTCDKNTGSSYFIKWLNAELKKK